MLAEIEDAEIAEEEADFWKAGDDVTFVSVSELAVVTY